MVEPNTSQDNVGGPHISTTGRAFTRVVSTERAMKTYPLSENELRQVTFLNSGMSVFATLALNFLLLAFGLKIDAIIQGVLTEEAKILIQVAVPVLFALALVCVAIAVWTWFRRRSVLSTIPGETKEMP